MLQGVRIFFSPEFESNSSTASDLLQMCVLQAQSIKEINTSKINIFTVEEVDIRNKETNKHK
jgi:hypothetical protein